MLWCEILSSCSLTPPCRHVSRYLSSETRLPDRGYSLTYARRQRFELLLSHNFCSTHIRIQSHNFCFVLSTSIRSSRWVFQKSSSSNHQPMRPINVIFVLTSWNCLWYWKSVVRWFDGYDVSHYFWLLIPYLLTDSALWSLYLTSRPHILQILHSTTPSTFVS